VTKKRKKEKKREKKSKKKDKKCKESEIDSFIFLKLKRIQNFLSSKRFC